MSAAHRCRARHVPHGPTDRDRLRVVVPMHVCDEHASDVTQIVSDVGERAFEQCTRNIKRPSAVDEDEAVPVLYRVDVHRTQPIHRERERDAVDARSDRLGPRLDPCVSRWIRDLRSLDLRHAYSSCDDLRP